LIPGIVILLKILLFTVYKSKSKIIPILIKTYVEFSK
jgi:hypothetical protein